MCLGEGSVGNKGEHSVGAELMPEGVVRREETSLDLPVLVVGVECAPGGFALGGSAEDHRLAWDMEHRALCHISFLLAPDDQWRKVFQCFGGLDEAQNLAGIERRVVHFNVAHPIIAPFAENVTDLLDGVARASCLTTR